MKTSPSPADASAPTRAFADAVVVAAGSSRRMGGLDKLDAPLLGRPLLAWAVDAMAAAAAVRRVVLVVAPTRVAAVRESLWLRERAVSVVAGGERRSDSVLAGLHAAASDVVLVHDGARPLASPALADAVASSAARNGAAAPVLPVVDSLKREQAGRLVGVEREGLLRAQTPQGARRELLLDAFAAARGAAFSDEVALLEAGGVPVAAVAGEVTNLKVTEPADLDVARALLAARDPALAAPRLGTGQDSHSFGPDDGLWLGGVLVPEAPRLYGHSDGDVVLHALASAVLGACGLGDLGRVFPPTDPRTRGEASASLLASVLDRAAEAGWRPATAQLSVVGARPRLGAERLDAMRERVAELLGVPPERVGLVASSGNLDGSEGAGRVIRASALVTMVPDAAAGRQ